MKIVSTAVLVILAAFIMSHQSGAQEGDMIRNGKFEIDTDGNGMADNWQFSGDQGVIATWERDKGFTGDYSQKLVCAQFTSLSPASHAMLCQLNTVQLEKGKWYKISFAAKQEGIRSRMVQVAISNTKDWNNCGLQESFRVPREWKQFETVFQASQTVLDNTRLQFWYNTTGTLWLDDVQLEPSEPVVRRYTEVIPAIEAKNLLSNSSFECGTSGWGSIADLPGWGGNLNSIVGSVDARAKVRDDGAAGRSSFGITLAPENTPVYYFDYFPLYRIPVKAPLLANRGWITVEPGTGYTLSAYMKSARADNLSALITIRQAFRGTLRKEVQITDEWKRYAFTFKPQAGQIFVALGPDLEALGRESGTIWIDDVQLEKGSEATAYSPRASVEVGLESSQEGNLFPYGEEPELRAFVFSSEDMPHRVTLHLKITDFDDKVINEYSISLDVSPGVTTRVPIKTGAQKMGFYRLHLSAEGAKVVDTNSLRFAIIEPHAESDSLFGMNHAYPWPHLLDLSKQMGLRWFRDWSLKWHDVEKEKGKFDFTEADYQIDRVLEQGLNVLPLLPFPSNNWASSAGPEVEVTDRYPGNRERIAYMPRDMEEFANYVRTTVENHKDRLHVWEIMNEPIYTDYSLPRKNGYQVTDYVKLLEVAYQAVKAADPDAMVIGGIAGGPTTYTTEFIEAGGLKWVDAFNLHTYPGLAEPESYDKPMSQLREKMRSVGMDKPIWFTEGAYYADDDMPYEPFNAWLKPLDSEAEAAEWQVKFNTILLAYGVKKIIYHSGTPGSLNNESLSGIFFEWAGAPRKMLTAQSAMSNLLPASINSSGRLNAPENVWAYGFETGEKTVIVAWTEEYAEVEISLAGKPWRAVDLQGNEMAVSRIPLTQRPVYFIKEGIGLAQLPW